MATKSGVLERFEMAKKRHSKTFQAAVLAKKADPKIIPLCRFLNRQKELFSSSSCSGRIVLLNLDSMETKRPGAFYYKKHEPVTAKTIWKKMNDPTQNELWFKQEAFILHLGTNTLENANRLLTIAKNAGIKRGGIMVAKPGKFLLEFIGHHHMSVPVKSNEKILITENYCKTLVKRANQKLAQNFIQLLRLENEFKKSFAD